LLLAVAMAHISNTPNITESFNRILSIPSTERMRGDWTMENSTVGTLVKMDDELIAHYTKYSALLQRFTTILNDRIKNIREKVKNESDTFKQKKVEVKLYKGQIKSSRKTNDYALIQRYTDLLKSSQEEMKAAKLRKEKEAERLKSVIPQRKIIRERLDWIESKIKKIGKRTDDINAEWRQRNETLINNRINYIEMAKNGSRLLTQLREGSVILKQAIEKLNSTETLSNETYLHQIKDVIRNIKYETIMKEKELMRLYF